ncbi:MAG: hypothetical protein E7103_04705 [Prevotella sp.]|nr:hypothetical protein [Prevotella sp.]
MEPLDEYVWIMIATGLSFLISLFVFFNTKRKWLGCILQFVSFAVLLIFSGIVFAMFRRCVRDSNASEAMVGVRLTEEDQDCRYETTWWMKPDNTYYYEYEKGSNQHKVEPCGNDSYDDKGTFVCLDSINAIKANINPSFVIYFDIDSQIVTPIYNNDTIEVITVNWELIKEYFDKR